MLRVARVVAATTLSFGVLGAFAALNLGDSPKKQLPVNWPAVISSSVMAIAGAVALVFIEPRVGRKS